MLIKTITPRKRTQTMQIPCYRAQPLNRQNYVSLLQPSESMFADDGLFYKSNQVSKMQIHPTAAKRIIPHIRQSVRNQSANSQRSYKCSKQTRKVNTHEKIQFNQSENRRFHALRKKLAQTLEVPEYARNMMKPCKIESVNLVNRPVSGRKTQTAKRMACRVRRNSENYDRFRVPEQIEPRDELRKNLFKTQNEKDSLITDAHHSNWMKSPRVIGPRAHNGSLMKNPLNISPWTEKQEDVAISPSMTGLMI